VGDLLWVVYCGHVSVLHRYGDMKPQTLDGRMLARMDFQVISYSVQCYALHSTDNNYFLKIKHKALQCWVELSRALSGAYL